MPTDSEVKAKLKVKVRLGFRVCCRCCCGSRPLGLLPRFSPLVCAAASQTLGAYTMRKVQMPVEVLSRGCT